MALRADDLVFESGFPEQLSLPQWERKHDSCCSSSFESIAHRSCHSRRRNRVASRGVAEACRDEQSRAKLRLTTYLLAWILGKDSCLGSERNLSEM